MQSLILLEKNALQSFFAENATIGIVIGKGLNLLDTTAAGVSLHLGLKAAGKSSSVIMSTEPTVEVSHLVGIDEVGKGASGKTNMLTISVPYRENEIDKVSYNIEGDRLNVNLFADTNGISFTEKDVLYIKKGSAPTLVVSIGVQSRDELSRLVDLKEDTKILSISTNSNSKFGAINLVDSGYSSNSEIVTELLYELMLPIDLDIAQNLLDGIVSATANFTDSKTSMFAFQSAGLLMQHGALRLETKVESFASNTFPKPDLLIPSDKALSKKMAQEYFGVKPASQNNQNRNQNNNRPQNGQNYPKQNSNNQQSFNNQPKQSIQREDPFKNMIQNNVPPVQPVQTSQPVQADSLNTPSPEEMPAVEGVSEDIPSDWFLPKVFKGGKKNNNN